MNTRSSRVTTPEDAERLLELEAAHRRENRRYPEDDRLATVLGHLLPSSGALAGPIAILARDRSGRASTFSNEVVTARGADGTELRLLCKYARTNSHPAFGHRRGIEYEIRMYADLLSELQLPTPRYYGSHHEPSTGEYWLVMEYFDGGLTVNKGPQPAAIVSAAQVMGDLHARGETLLRQADL